MAKKQAKRDAAKAAEPPLAEYIKNRGVIWTKLKTQFDAEIAAKPRDTINVTLPDGVTVEGTTWQTTPFDVAKGIPGLASHVLVAKVNNVLWDIERPLESDCEIELLKFEEPEAKAVLWKSASYVVGEVLERLYGEAEKGLLCNTATDDNGFHVDYLLPETEVQCSFLLQMNRFF